MTTQLNMPRNFNFKPKKKLVFSGSGTAIYLHIGAYLAICRNIDIVALEGTSGGSIIASLVACGYSAKEIENIAKELDLKELTDYDINFFNGFGILKGKKLLFILKKYLNINFADLYNKTNIPLDILATNLVSGKCTYFNHINTPNVKVYDAVRCSLSIPLLFKYHVVNNIPFFDGGMTNNFDIDHYSGEVIGFRIISAQQGINISQIENLKINSFWELYKIFAIKTMLTALVNYVIFCVNLLIVSIEQKHIEDALTAKIITLKSNFNPVSFGHSKQDINEMIQTGKETVKTWLDDNLL